MNSNKILYDLVIAGVAMSGWLIPSSANLDFLKALSLSTSVLFSGRAYYSGIVLLAKERRDDERKGVVYEAEMEILDSSYASLVENAIEVKALEFENKALQLMIPLVQENESLKRLISRHQPIHPEFSEEDREQAARAAIDEAFEGSQPATETKPQVSEGDIRAKYPETADSTTWKAISKAIANGASREEILIEVLQANNDIGKAYLDLLKQKYL